MKTYTLHIDAYSPETIPMARLAEYMQHLAAILGHQSGVHFDAVLPGSTQLAAKIDYEYQPKVRTAVAALKQGDGAPEQMKAQKVIDDLLAEDNADGFLYVDGDPDAKVIEFPGVRRPKPLRIGPIRQEGSLDGVLVRVGGADKTAHLQLQNGDIRYSSLETDRDTARKLARHLYEVIRVLGTGSWMREEDGNWTLKKFTIRSFEVLADDDLRSVIDRMRAVEGSEWKDMDDAQAMMSDLRGGGVH